ncbi:aldo/keto reductase [Nocardioidaceae bacterium SCSIO 66511]|nr:aldo/keto reductase [Nocardioidaceae bacterium SCSIO 66511]
MRQRYVGRSGLRVSRIGLGTLTWGRDTDEHEAREQLTSFLDAGGNLVDTAVSYGDGASEELIGSLLATTVNRDEVVLSSKAGVAPGTGERDTSRRTLLRQLDTTLARLGVDHLDLWQVQTWVPEIPLEETLSALDYAVRTGRTAYVGVSNYTGWQCALAHTTQSQHVGGPALVSTQVEYSLLNRDVELEVVPAAEALGMGVIAWSPLGRGVLTGKYRTGTPADSRGASPQFERFVGVYLGPSSRRIVEAVARAADGLQLSPTEVALAWVRDRPGVSSAVVGARTAAQLKGTLLAEDVELPDEIAAALDDVSEHGEE